MRRFPGSLVFLLAVCLLPGTADAGAGPGDLVAVDEGWRQLFVIHPDGGTEILHGFDLHHQIMDVVCSADGKIYVATYGLYYESPAMICRVNPANGGLTAIASWGPGLRGQTLSLGAGGRIYAGIDWNFFGVDAASGSSQLVSSLGVFNYWEVTGTQEASDGSILVSDPGNTGASVLPASVTRVDPVTGAQTTLSQGGFIQRLTDIALGPLGEIYVVDNSDATKGIVRVDPVSGNQQVVSDHGLLDSPYGLTLAPDGTLLVANRHSIVRVDPATGAQSTYWAGDGQLLPFRVAVMGDVPTPATPSTWSRIKDAYR